MTDTSARFAWPFILPGQAQKEAYHNEALSLIDAALHAAVQEDPVATPPAGPEEGRCWIVADGATGAWTDRTDSLACWTGGGWRFVAPLPGMLASGASIWVAGCTGRAITGATAACPRPRFRSAASKSSVRAFRMCQVPLAER